MSERVPELDELLGEVPGEQEALAEVRARVLARVGTRRSRPLWLAAAAMLALALLSGWLARRTVAPPAVLTYEMKSPAVPEIGLRGHPAEQVRAVRARRKPARVAPVHQPITVKLETEDPNVVIVWITD